MLASTRAVVRIDRGPRGTKALLTRTIQLERERRDVESVARSLRELADANRQLNLLDEGIQQAKEALEVYERLGKTVEQASRLISLARLSLEDKQLDAAIEVMSRGLGLLSEESQEFLVCRSHRVLGKIYQSKGERVKAIHHFEVTIEIATPLDRLAPPPVLDPFLPRVAAFRRRRIRQRAQSRRIGQAACHQQRMVPTTQTRRGDIRGFARARGLREARGYKVYKGLPRSAPRCQKKAGNQVPVVSFRKRYCVTPSLNPHRLAAQHPAP